ncbi:MAG: methyltransferase domain-containing protein [Lentilitoribacter sp.]
MAMSDDPTMADMLSDKLNYVNTHLHSPPPTLDITNIGPDDKSQYDVVISSEVFEHVPPPIQKAFDNLFQILKPGGIVIFSVPFTLEDSTLEHYPNLYDFQIVEEDGQPVLHNTTVDGEKEKFTDLIFHGAPEIGGALELRVMAKKHIIECMQKAGFVDIKFRNETCEQFGIKWHHEFSIPMTCRRP